MSRRTRALLPQPVARLVGLAALSAVGALEWQRLVSGVSSGRALLWALVAVAAAVGVLLAERPGRLRAVRLPLVTLAAVLGAYLLSGIGLDYLKPRHWDELLSGLGSGLQALGTVRLPYRSADPWPGVVLELMGAELLALAGLLTFWPRAPQEDVRFAFLPTGRGYPFVALAVLLVVVISPVVSLGGSGTRSLVLGLGLAALTVCFLWLERLPLRPGLGVAGLLAAALAGALPLAAAADRGEPWFDYRTFAENLGPDDPIRFSWQQSYGPMTWPREGNEVMRVVSEAPLYWKARNLDVFDGETWTTRTDPVDTGSSPVAPDLADGWRSAEDWTRTVEFSVRRMRITDVIGAGTTVSIDDESRAVQPGVSPGTWDAPSGLRRGDSYRARVHVPAPTQGQLEDATAAGLERLDGERELTLPIQPDRVQELSEQVASSGFGRWRQVTEVRVGFGAWDGTDEDFVSFARFRRGPVDLDLDTVMSDTVYARTWELSKQLKQGAERPMDYVRAVYDYLHGSTFRYSETPAQPPAGVEPLDYFLNESHEGYCQHYAGAMALLLRMGGIPARVATGFSPGGYSERKKAWVVRDTDAHAWVEVWFDDYGWVTIDPTPEATPARSLVAALTPELDASTPATAAEAADDDSDASSSEATDPSVPAEQQLAADDGIILTSTGGGVPWFVWAAAGTVLGLALVLAALLYLRRPRGPTPMDRAIAEVEDALRRVGRPVTPGTTMFQLARRLGSDSPEVASYLRALAEGRYAPAPATPPPRSGRRALRRALAQGLGFGGRLRALWALPPLPQRRAPRSRTLEVETSVRA